MQYPSLQELYDKAEGEELLVLRRSPRSILGFIISALFSFIVVCLIVYNFGGLRLPIDLALFRFLGPHVLFIVPIGIGLEALRRFHNDLWIIERTRIIHKGGRIALNYSVPVIKFGDVRGKQVAQTVFGRIFDYGDIELGTAAHDDTELKIQGIRAPTKLVKLLDELTRDARSGGPDEFNRL
jgi:hypothetical protein